MDQNCHGPKGYSPREDPGELTRDEQQLAPGRTQNRKSRGSCLVPQRKGLWLGSSNQPALPFNLKLPLLTTGHELNLWPTEKMVAFMHQYQWENISKATKSAYLAFSRLSEIQPREACLYHLGRFNLPDSPFRVWHTDFM